MRLRSSVTASLITKPDQRMSNTNARRRSRRYSKSWPKPIAIGIRGIHNGFEFFFGEIVSGFTSAFTLFKEESAFGSVSSARSHVLRHMRYDRTKAATAHACQPSGKPGWTLRYAAPFVVNPQELRKSETVRSETAKAIVDIVQRMAAYMGVPSTAIE
jgi:hypothetical protein